MNALAIEGSNRANPSPARHGWVGRRPAEFIVKLLSMRRHLALVALPVVLAGCTAPPTFDLVIRGGQVYDGISTEPQRVDVAIVGDRIAAVGALASARALREIDAQGLVVAPGFIDVQSRSGESLLADGGGESHLRQGITSEIGDRESLAFGKPGEPAAAALRPFGVNVDWSGLDGYFEQLSQRGVAINLGALIPLAETGGSSAVIDRGMRDGALGVAITRDDSSRREWPTGKLLEAALRVAQHGGVVAIQPGGTRDELLYATDEAIDVARQTKATVVLYQPEATEESNDVLGELLAKMQVARAQGVTINSTATPLDDEKGSTRGWWFRDAGASVGSRSAALRADGILARKTAQPRASAAFTTVLADYVRDDKVIALGEAIRRMTSNAAAQFHLDGRGTIRAGSAADIVVFDLALIRRHATTERPHEYSTGMQHVIVNGVAVLDPRGLTGARPGRPLFGRARVAERPPS
jgi:N-acyl-D-aspartate/D-glutamate deacylase